MKAFRRCWAAIATCAGVALSGMVFFAVPSVAAEIKAAAVPVELWDRPRSGQIVMSLPAIQQTVASLMADPASRLVIRHASGSEAAEQAEEIKAWMVVHAVDPERLELRADLAPRQPVQLEIVPVR